MEASLHFRPLQTRCNYNVFVHFLRKKSPGLFENSSNGARKTHLNPESKDDTNILQNILLCLLYLVKS